MAEVPPVVYVLHSTLGAYFVADMLAGVLLGGLFAQTWTYYNNYAADHIGNKLLVGFIFFSNLFHQILMCHPLYDITITHYSDARFLASLPWTFIAMSFVNAFIACTIQLWFTYRIYRLSKNSLILSVPIAILSVGQLVINSIMCGIAANLRSITEIPKVVPYITAFSSMGAGIDILIAIVVAYLLNKNRTGFKRTDSVINKLMLYCANTGLLTSVAAILTIVLHVSYPGTSINYPPYFALPRLYGISFVAILNSRTSLKLSASSITEEMSMKSQHRTHQPSGGVAISVTQTVLRDDEAFDGYSSNKTSEYL